MASENKRPKKPRKNGPGRPFEKGNKFGRRFAPGESGNPGGRPKSFHEFTEAHRDMIPDAQAELREMLKSDSKDDRRFAITTIYNRAFGRAPLPLTGAGGEGPVQVEGDALLQMLLRLEQSGQPAPAAAPAVVEMATTTPEEPPAPALPAAPVQPSRPPPKKSSIAEAVQAALGAARSKPPADGNEEDLSEEDEDE